MDKTNEELYTEIYMIAVRGLTRTCNPGSYQTYTDYNDVVSRSANMIAKRFIEDLKEFRKLEEISKNA